MNIVTFDQVTPLLKNGAVGVMPTDTVYGLVTLASDHMAVHRFYSLKSREQKPGTLISASTDQVAALGVSWSEIDKVARYWPNPLSAVLPVEGNEYLHQGVGTLAMRVVVDTRIRDLLEQTGPLITSSANQPGQPPATTIQEAIGYFGDSVDFYVDGGEIKDVLPSTIIRPIDGGIEVLRQGSITL
jgi:L-threonylcarbamoyladenylate synthase